ncbi:Ig-like domain-containing protein [Nocardioides hwasunensis]|uniref:Ig-like domain repeat protein n=1 Tax=Nocardioides hwasunensis TaxID=397258 RepID=A0ABR8MK40_9ACTN|nr:Ig-like domain-containing protein [Nocardioides hwasunensis]MBD3915135.1 Ig-like domain repeat protein [Nocardioides hwasunensis]
MRLTPSRRAGLGLSAVLLVTPLAALVAAPASAEPAGAAVSGDGWAVTRAPGGYLVTVDLDRALPMKSDAPTVVVDGETLGLATQSADGRSISTFTTDSAVLTATSAEAGWASQAPEGEGTPSRAVTVPDAAAAADPLDVDPSAPGSFEWTESIYKFGDQAIPLAAIGGVRGEMEGKVYLPTTGGARPTVLLLHGRHTSCYTAVTGTPANPARWPCTAAPGPAEAPYDTGRMSIPSYAGYDGTARALASRGYAVVSISANAVNSNDNELAADQGAQARGQLLLDTLTMLKKANAGEVVSYYDAFTGRDVSLAQALTEGSSSYALRAPGFVNGAPALDTITPATLVGRFDLSTIGMMGHSRGGEGVTSAATLNQALPNPWNIESILPLAPVDFGRMTVPNVPMNVILPYCDGDVSNQQGQHMLDDSRYAYGDDALRSGTWVMGANHNFYNTVWTPGEYAYSVSDDWSNSTARRTEPTCGTDPSVSATSIRMTPAEQYAQGTAYMTAWFRLTLGDERQFLPMFDGTGSVPDALGGEDVRTTATAPSGSRATIATFERSSSLVRTFGTATANPCASMNARTTPQDLAACTTTMASSQLPHWTPASNGGNVPATPVTRMTWTSGTGAVRVSVPAGRRDAGTFERLSVKLAADETVVTGTDLTLTVVDGRSQTWSSLVSALNPLALVRMPTSSSTAATSTLKKVVLQQVNVPVADLAAAGLDTSDIREVRFTAAQGADAVATGGAYLSDLAFESSSVGRASNRTEPVVNVYAPGVDEGSAPGTVELAAYLDKPATVPVTGWVSLLGATTSRAGATMEKVTFAPGETCQVVTAAVQGDTAASTTAVTSVKASIINVSGAVQGQQAIVFMRIREDDELLPSGTPPTTPARLPEFGTPGPACAELDSVLGGGSVTVPATTPPGTTASVSSAGFRAGEAVTFSAAGVESVTSLADAAGTATADLVVPTEAPRGALAVTATAAGTTRVTSGGLGIRDASTTTLAISPEAPALRQTVRMTATVAGGDTGGTVTFADGATVLGTAATVDGVATLTVPGGLGAGAHTLTATFAQSAVTTASESAPVAFTLAKATPTTVVTLSSASSVFGSPAATADVVVGGAVGGGEVAMTIGATTVSVPLDGAGRASYALPGMLPAGSYVVSARYLGSADAEQSAASSAPYAVTAKATTTTLKAASKKRGKRVRVTVTVAGAVPGAPVTGTVRVVLRGGVKATRTVSVPASGRVVVSVPVKAKGTKGKKARKVSVRASYSATGSYASSKAPSRTVRLR